MAGFFVTDGTLAQGAPSYIVRQADSDLLQSLERREFAYVLDSRQKGKSSLMIRTRQSLEETGISTVLLDLQRFGANLDAARWYGSMLLVVGEQLGCEDELFDYWDEQVHAGPMLRFFGAISKAVAKRAKPCVIFVDEVDYVRSLPFSADEFFAGIRECHNRKADGSANNLSFCLLGVSTPSELIRDVRITPFNIGRRIELTDFTLNDLMPYAAVLGEGGRDGLLLLSRLHHWTSGHPYLTQKLASAIVADASIRRTADVDRLVEALFFSQKAKTQDPNLSDVSRRVLESPVEGISSEETRSRMLDLYHQVRTRRVRDDETDPVVTVLKLTGIVSVVGGYLAVRNQIYFRAFDRAWINANLPDAEMLRQRQAARQASVRVGAVAGGVTIALAALAFFGFAEAARANSAVTQLQSALAQLKSEKTRADAKARDAESYASRLSLEKNAALGATAKAVEKTKVADLALKARDKALNESKEQATLANEARDRAVQARHTAARETMVALKSKETANHLLYQADMNLMQNAWDNRQFTRAQVLLDETGKPEFDAVRGLEWGLMDRRMHTAVATLTSPGDTCLSGSVSADGSRAITVSEKNGVQVWEPISGKLVAHIATTGKIEQALFSPAGSSFLVSDGSSLRFFSASAELRTQIPKQHNGCFSPDGRRILAFDDKDARATVWDAATGRPDVSLVGRFGTLQECSFAPNGREILTLDSVKDSRSWKLSPRPPRLWDAESGRLIATLEHLKGRTPVPRDPLFLGGQTIRPSGLAVDRWALFSPDSRTIAVAGDRPDVDLWTAGGDFIKFLSVNSASTLAIRFSPDSGALAILKASMSWYQTNRGASGHFGPSQLVSWNLRNLSEKPRAWKLERTDWKFDGVESSWIEYSPEGNRMVACLTGTSPKLIDLATGKMDEIEDSLNPLHPHFSPDGATLSFLDNGLVRVYNVHGPTETTDLLCADSTSEGTFAVFPDGEHILTLGVTARVYSTTVNRQAKQIAEHVPYLTAQLSPDGKTVALGGSDRSQMLDLQHGTILVTYGHGARSICFSKDGSTVASTDGNHIFLWDPKTGRDRRAPIPYSSRLNQSDVCFSVDGRTVIVTDDLGEQSFQLSTGKEIKNSRPEKISTGVELFKREANREVRRSLEGAYTTVLAVSADKSRAIVSVPSDYRRHDRVYRVLDTWNGRPVLTLPGGLVDSDEVAELSKTNSQLLLSQNDSLYIWPTTPAASSTLKSSPDSDRLFEEIDDANEFNDIPEWHWLAAHKLTPSLRRSPAVQAKLLQISEQPSNAIPDEAAKMLVHRPSDLYLKRSNGALAQGLLEQGERDLETHISKEKATAVDWTNLAYLKIGRGDTEGFMQATQTAIDLANQPGASEDDITNAASAVFLTNSAFHGLDRLLEGLRRGFARDKTRGQKDPWLGALLYRMGRTEEAEAALRQDTADEPWRDTFLALTDCKLGKLDEASKSLSGCPRLDKLDSTSLGWDAKIGLRIVLTEAVNALKAKGIDIEEPTH